MGATAARGGEGRGHSPGAAAGGVRLRHVAGLTLLVAVSLAVPLGATSCGELSTGGASPGRPSQEAVPVVTPTAPARRLVVLPSPRASGLMSLEEALYRRRSVREFAAAPLTLTQLGQLLWAAQGITQPAGGLRTAPSAGALYPLEVYAAVSRVAGLPPGVYRYIPESHGLELVTEEPVSRRLCDAALSQPAIGAAPLTLALTAVFSRTTAKYGERGRRYVVLEAGHAAENVCLQAVALGLGAVPTGAFDDHAVGLVLELGFGEEPLYLLPVGSPASP